jgi:hypothetical protein
MMNWLRMPAGGSTGRDVAGQRLARRCALNNASPGAMTVGGNDGGRDGGEGNMRTGGTVVDER